MIPPSGPTWSTWPGTERTSSKAHRRHLPATRGRHLLLSARLKMALRFSLLAREGQAQVLLDDVARQGHAGRRLGQPAGDHGPALPQPGVTARPVDGCKGVKFLFPRAG